jgi:formylglycine-generating enzyme required for sulfatase activity
VKSVPAAVIAGYFKGCDQLFDTVGAGINNGGSGYTLHRITRDTIMTRLSFKPLSLWLAALACLLAAPAGADQITYDMVTVGNPGNANDTGGTFNGAVNYSYQIGKYEVTIGQYTAFLNAVDPTGANPNDIYNAAMATDRNIAGIRYTAGASAGAKYSVIDNEFSGGNSGNRPITYVTWFDAARFANWMTNGQGTGSTETGAYTLNGATSGDAVAVNPGATFRLPTENEWYKAAYYDPTLNGGSGGYYAYATQSNDAPGNTIGSGANQANYAPGGVYSVTQSSTLDPNQNYLTDVGAFSGSGSFYGTFDQSGNVYQWNDLDGAAGSSRGLRGGDWTDNDPFNLSSSYSALYEPSAENGLLGFRLASPVSEPSAVPEIDPNSLGSVLALVLGSLGLLERRRLKAA